MFARNVALNLKPNTTVNEFTRLFEKEILPILRKQKGFQDEITLAPIQGGRDLTAISLWDTKESADAYNASISGYPEVLKLMAKVVEDTPRVRTSEVLTSTFQKTATHVAA
jgi:hypothetical protein